MSLISVLNIELFVCLVVCFLLVYGVFVERVVGAKKQDLQSNLNGLLIFIFLCVGWLWVNKLNLELSIWNNQILGDQLYQIFSFCIILIIFLSLILPFEVRYSYEFITLVLIYLLGGLFILNANDFTIFYLAVELQAFAVYVLIALNMRSVVSIESAYKYFIMGALGSFLLLIGGVILYGTLGTLNYNDWSLLLFSFDVNNPLTTSIIIGAFSLVLGVLLKLALAPLHFWVADVYEGCTWNVMFYVSLVNKITLIGALVRFLNLFSELNVLTSFLLIISFLSLLFGIAGAFQQLNFKRFFAYTGIVNIGYLAGSFSVFSYGAFYSSLFYFIIYVINFAAFMSLVLLVQDRIRMRFINSFLEVGFLAKNFPLLALFLSLLLFSFGGVPPLAGFFAKFMLLFALLEDGAYLAFIFITLSSIISVFYYIRIVKKLFFLPQQESILFMSRASDLALYGTLGLVFFNLFFIIKPYFFLLLIDDIVVSFWLAI